MSHFLLLIVQLHFLLKFIFSLAMDLQVQCHSHHSNCIPTTFCSAVAPDDYVSLNVTLMFAACETRRCVDVTIENDFDSEPDEDFFYTLERTPGLHPSIDLAPVDGDIVIVDDGDG